jgi:UDP-N-acetylenolpyruvoylglucosamine reductase
MELKTQCRFAVGGPADYFVTLSEPEELFAAFEFAFDRGLRTFVYSGGSNLFFDDEGFRGLVVRLKGGSWNLDKRVLPPPLMDYQGRDSLALNEPTDDLTENGGPFQADPGLSSIPFGPGELVSLGGAAADPTPVVKVSGGFELSRLVRELARLDVGGIEFLGNIPGSVAGAVVGNAGCYGRAIAEVLVEAQIYPLQTHEVTTVGPDYFEFGYRHSKLKYDPQNIVVSATLRLAPRQRSLIMSEVDGELAERLSKHPHDAACAGSFFQNPSRERPAWRLLTDAGMVGEWVGGAQFSPKHANFLVNTGDARSTDIIRLARKAQLAVLEHSGFELVPEVRYVGPEGIVEPLPDL